MVSFIGQTLGKYEILEVLGQGGMATVYKGYHREVDRYAAIKVLPPHPGRDPLFVKRFRLEARTIAHLQHPYILPLYDFESEDDILYLAMAYVEGGSLGDLLRTSTLPLYRVEKLLREIGSALHYAHRQGVIHRDIKPANILLDNEDHALLADFGIAKQMGVSSTLTGAGNVLGTPAYMSPEQSLAETIDQRADIYSLGIVAYEMLTGKQPYIGTNPLRMIMKHVYDPIPSITAARPDLPAGLEAVMQRVLAKTAAERYQTALDFIDAFSRAIHGRDFTPPVEISTPLETTGDTTDVAVRTITMAYSSEPLARRTYTFLFTDIEGSTRLWERHPEKMSVALAYHDEIMAQTIEAYGGEIFKTVGDGVYAVFDTATDAVNASLTIQHLLYQASTRAENPLLPLAVRMGLYSGQAEERANDYFGITLNRGARLMSAGHGRQILLSATTKDLLPPDIELRDLGSHNLRGLREAEHIYQAISTSFPLNAKPIQTLTPRPSNLPAQLTSFVGREQNVDEICRLLRAPNTRLLTLLGPGGIGKTRLSIQVGTTLLDEFEDGVFFIPLAPLNQTDAVIKTLVQALSIPEDMSIAPLDALKAHLETREMLLIFDNFEHILDAAPTLNQLLTTAERLTILATSRESLFIYGERTYTVPPLNLPEPGDDISRLLKSSAVNLFVERVQAMMSEFTLAEDNAPTVVRICRQLEGLPLALELAAARIRDLTLAEIDEGLGQRLALLSKGQRDLSPRQRTMRGAIEWSYDLLSPDDQRAFARLSVFEGEFYIEAAQAVVGIPDLKAFTSKSLIQQPDDRIYSMLAVLREFALERLADFDESRSIREKHSSYYCAWLEEAQYHLNGRDQIDWYHRLKVEQYNFQAALEWFVQQEQFENAGRMVAVLWRYWAMQSLLSEGAYWNDQVLAHTSQLSPRVLAGVTQGAGRLALLRSEFPRATELQQRSLTLYQSAEYQPGQAQVLLSLGETEFVQGNYIAAENYLGESLSLFRLIDNEAGIGRCLNIMGNIVMQNGDFLKAEPLLRESLALARTHGSSEGVALALYDLGVVLRALGKFADAETAFRESLDLFTELNLAVGVGTMLYSIGYTQQGQGNYRAALEKFLEALRILQPLDEPLHISECLIGLAGAFLHQHKRSLGVRTLSAANAALTAINGMVQLSYADKAEYDRTYAAANIDPAEPDWADAQTAPLEQIILDVFQEAKPGVTIVLES